MSVVVQGDGEQVAISEMLFRRCKQKIDKHGTCSAGRRRKDERVQKCHCKLRNAFRYLILVLQGKLEIPQVTKSFLKENKHI